MNFSMIIESLRIETKCICHRQIQLISFFLNDLLSVIGSTCATHAIMKIAMHLQ